MTREEEKRLIKEYVNKNGVTLLPPDERGPDFMISAWARPKKKRGRKKKQKTA